MNGLIKLIYVVTETFSLIVRSAVMPLSKSSRFRKFVTSIPCFQLETSSCYIDCHLVVSHHMSGKDVRKVSRAHRNCSGPTILTTFGVKGDHSVSYHV